jgi:hypothetical protein
MVEGDGGEQRRLPLPSREQDDELALSALHRLGDAPLERLEVEAYPFAELPKLVTTRRERLPVWLSRQPRRNRLPKEERPSP